MSALTSRSAVSKKTRDPSVETFTARAANAPLPPEGPVETSVVTGSTIAPGELLATYSRDTAIGPPKGVHYKVVLPDGQKVYIHRLHFDHVRRIDGEVVED
mgnify:CR=1 FL=1